MRVLISPTAFKGTLSPVDVSRRLATLFKRHHPSWIVSECPVADGGDGTLDVLATVLKAKIKKTRVTGPLGKKVDAPWARVGKTAIIEMARASGLALVRNKNRIMEATTYGTGELIRAALDAGCKKIVIGVGGTATGEGGAGALQALGLSYLDKKEKRLSGSPKDLIHLKRIEWARLDPRLCRTKIFVLCDVTNPLLGPRGSARTFGPQKGATASQVKKLEQGLRHWATFARFQTKNFPGAGAAGALAFGLSAFLGAKMVKGSPYVFNMLKWKSKASRADVIIAGEGQVDQTSFSGKTIGEIMRNKRKARLFLICGRNCLSPQKIKQNHISGVVELGPRGLRSPEKALTEATKLLLRKIR